MANRKMTWIVALAAAVITVSVLTATLRGDKKNAAPPVERAIDKTTVAGPGRVEPDSEEVKIGSEISGKLREVLVEEGAQVKKGQVLAVLVNDEYRAAVENGEAMVRQKEAAWRKVMNGSRTQERQEAEASVHEAETVEANARSEMERRQQLWKAGVTSREEAERHEREYGVAKAKLDAARQHFRLVDDLSREEDRSAARAELEEARAQLAENRAVYEKTWIRAPFDGTILRKHHRTGESITNSSVTQDPIFTMGDVSGLRVRVDVDETDVSRVREGQAAYVTAQAYPGEKFGGTVIRVGGQLGPKNVRTDEPKEKIDTKILETLVQLDKGVKLPVGLRVDAYINTAK
jgi:ABC exporter DevB family membrane fusion protein